MAPTPLEIFAACFPCLPCLPQGGARKQQQAINGSHRAGYYNTQLRSNLGMPERPLRLPVMVADDEPQSPAATNQGSDASLPQQQQLQPPRPTPNSSATTFSSVPSSRTASKPRGRFPTVLSGDSGKSCSDVPMETAQLTELFDKLAKIDFIPYAICGRGALVDHGLSARKTKQVSIVMPSYSKDVLAGWARSSGWVSTSATAQGKASIFVGIPLADGTVRQLRIKYLDDEQFEQLERVRSRLSSKAWVLSLTSQLDHLAAAWIDYHKKAEEKRAKAEAEGGSRGSVSTTTTTSSKYDRPPREIARDILWTLDRMARTRVEGTSGAEPRLLQTLSSEDFFVPFTERHPEALVAMARAGVDVAAVMAGLRHRSQVREHNAILAEYGAEPLDRFSVALPFAGIRDLNHSKSVYTLATNASATELGPNTPTYPLSSSSATASAPAPEPTHPSSGAAALLDRITGQARRGSSGSGRAWRSRSVRVSGARPSISGPIAVDGGQSDRNLTRSASTTRAPPRTSEIPRAEPARRSSADQWI